MIIKQAEYTVSAVKSSQYPQEGEKEIALVGRSNVGKSSLINKIINRRGLARTSSQPGKTRTLNFYHINDAWYFVDLPGYGYAKVSKSMQESWAKFINDYLAKREELVGIIMIIDIRHPPTKDDMTMYNWVKQSGLPYLLVATKADKIARGKWLKNRKIIQEKLAMDQDASLVCFSATSGQGVEEVKSWLQNNLGIEEE